MTLANILRTDAYMHRTLPRRHRPGPCDRGARPPAQDAVWRLTKATQELRSLQREYYPGFLAPFVQGTVTNLANPEAREALALAPTSAAGARLSKARIAAALRRAGRQRGIDALAIQIQHRRSSVCAMGNLRDASGSVAASI